MGMRLRARSWTGENDEGEPTASPRYEQEAAFQQQSLLTEQQAYLKQGEDEDMPSTGLRAIFFNQGKTFFLLLASWILFILYIRLVGHPIMSHHVT